MKLSEVAGGETIRFGLKYFSLTLWERIIVESNALGWILLLLSRHDKKDKFLLFAVGTICF